MATIHDSSPAAATSRRWPLAERADLRELLDGHRASQAVISQNLRDLARLNRLAGGTGASVAAIARLATAGEPLAVLDVGAGLGDMALSFARRGWRTVAADSHPQVLAEGRAATANEPLVEVVEVDGRRLPYADDSFDVAHSSLLVHHLDPDDAVLALREMCRVARRGVVINDLRRGVLPLLATGIAVAALGTCRATRADGIASVRRAYTVRELDALIEAAGLRVAWRTPRVMPRVVSVAVRADSA